MDLITVTINNWAKYNPRNDRKNYSWFRFQTNFFADPVIFSLSTNERVLMLFIFCEASKTGQGRAIINVEQAAMFCRMDAGQVEQALEKFNKFELVSFNNQTPADGNQNESVETGFGSPTNERTNERNERTDDTNERTGGKVIGINIKAPTPAAMIDLFNNTIGGCGKVSKYPSHSLPPRALEHYRTLLGFPELSTTEGLKAYFETAKSSKFLNGESGTFVASLLWLINPDNALKVLSGQYKNLDKKTKADDVVDHAVKTEILH